jgi:antitoxin component YwqK of YwqJK toxin-antitoxin module
MAGVAGAWLWRRSPAPLPERPLSDLIKVEGRFLLRGDTNQTFTGWVTEQYASGVRRSRSQVADGRLHGVSEGWHTNGVRQVTEHFVAGESEGLVTKWHLDGTKAAEGTSRAGKYEGAFRRWHTNGVLAEELNLVAGEPHGVARSWFPSGSPKAEATLEHGRVVKQQFWKDGERMPEPALAEAGKGP